MIDRETLDNLINNLFPEEHIDPFSINWILNSPGATKESINKVYKFLKEKGLGDEKIATHAYLLGMNPETIERNYQALKKLGIKDEKIATYAELLGMDPETIERNYQALKELGIKDEKIASRAELLGRDPETIERNYQALKKLGIKDEKIASQAHLLGMNPETIERNYQNHIGLLRQDYKNRTSGRDLLTNQAQLLGISPETINANVQFLYNLKIDYCNTFLLGTTPQLKRNKMAWMLRELFDYKNLSYEERKDAIYRLYSFVRDNPGILARSINSLDKNKEYLIERIAEY